MNVVPFQTEHLWAIDAQPSQEYVLRAVTPEYIKPLEEQNAFTCMHENKVLACFGWVEIYSTRAALWALISASSGKHFVAMTRIAKRLVDSLPHKRLEMEVDCEFEQGHRWARILGFTLDVPRLRAYRLDGGDSAIYARIRA